MKYRLTGEEMELLAMHRAKLDAKDQKDDEGFSVVDGKLCVTYERED